MLLPFPFGSESLHGFATAHRGDEPWRSGETVMRAWTSNFGRAMGGPEPDRHPSPCPLPARRGEGGRLVRRNLGEGGRPGEGAVHGRKTRVQIHRKRGP